MEDTMLGKHQPIYMEDTSETNYPSLNQDIEADIVIVGGGIVGLTLAYLLKDSKQRVVLLEADRIVMGMSARTTAKLTPCHNLIYAKLKETKGLKGAKQYVEINMEAVQFAKDTIEKEKISCDFRKSPFYVYTTKEEDIGKIKKEIEVCKEIGMPIQYKESLPLNLPIKAALEWEEAYIFHIRKYLLRLAELFVEAGGQIYEKSAVQAIAPDDMNGLQTKNGHYIHAKKIVIASHYPMYDGLGFYFTRLQMKRNYVIGVKVSEEKMPVGNYISADTPRFSVRPVPEKGVVLIGGGEHRTGDDKKEFAHFEELFNPMRGDAFRGKTFRQHNVEGIKCYLQGKLHQIPVEVFPKIGEATTTRLEDGNVYGIYQDEEECYHIVDIVCTHIGATLRWNSAEKSWDCPFHGSRFSIDGEVLEGPSTHKLNSYREEKNHIHPNIY